MIAVRTRMETTAGRTFSTRLAREGIAASGVVRVTPTALLDA